MGKTAAVYSVWFFGRDDHFGNFLSKNCFPSLGAAKAYARETMNEVSEAYNLYDSTWGDDDALAESAGMPADEFKKKWEMDAVPSIWLLSHADCIRIIKDENPGDIRAEWQATYNSDGEFEGWVSGSR